MTTTTKQQSQKKFTQADFDKVNQKIVDDFGKQYLENNPDPFSPIKTLCKSFALAMFLACASSVAFAAYDEGYRKVLRTTFPFGAAFLDLLMDREEESVMDQEESSKEASIFREEFKDALRKS